VLATNLQSYKFDPLPAPPTMTYNTADHVVRLGKVEVRVYHFGRAHTGGDSVVYFPDLKVVATSDAVTNGAPGPLADYAGGGSWLEWTGVLDSMLKLDFDTAIPGAGNNLTRADVMAFRTKFNTVIDRAKALVRQGIPKEELLAKLDTADIGWAPRIPDVGAFYDEVSKAKR
jgi:glyoxylase-like metal-dependent hydrolase (beta-lactamase superfamily II)